MNIFNEAIYKNHLEHSQKGQTWGKHKYLYITETGRYVYPEDLANGKSQQQFRKRQINDQIKSAHVGSTTPAKRNLTGTQGYEISPTGKKVYWTTDSQGRNRTMSSYAGEIRRNNTVSAKKQQPTNTSGVAAGSKSVSTPATRNTITIKKSETTTPAKTEEKKTETTTSTDGDKYKNMSEEMKEYLRKNAGKDEKKKSGKKGSGGSKKKGSSSKTSTKTEEAGKLGLSDDDLKKMEVNTQATDREEVLKNIALRVIRGDYGNGADRKAKLGNYYDEVQKRVNELMKSGSIQREGQSAQQTSQKTEQKASTSSSQNTSSKESEPKVEKTETQKRNAEEIQVAKQLAEMSGMKNSATLKLIKLYKNNSNSKDFKEELNLLSEGDEKQKKNMLRLLGQMKHSDLESDYLIHWGKKHRSGRFKFGSGERPYQHEGKVARNHSWHDRRTMPIEELDKALTRARKELDLYNAERNNRSATQKFVEDVLTSVGKTVVITAATGGLKYAGRQFIEKSLENPELADAMFGNNGGGKKNKKNNKKK